MADFLRSLYKLHIIYNSFIRSGAEIAFKISGLYCSRGGGFDPHQLLLFKIFHSQVYLSFKGEQNRDL